MNRNDLTALPAVGIATGRLQTAGHVPAPGCLPRVAEASAQEKKN
jgi:hypothetical protein